MFLANTRQYEKLNFTLDYEHFFHFGEVCRAILKKISQKKNDVGAPGGTFVCVTFRVPRGALASIFFR